MGQYRNLKRVITTQRGDTIVEVLIALAVLGAVLGSAYVVVNRNVTINQTSQERLQAVKVAESQFEQVKVSAIKESNILSWTDFCLPNNRKEGDPKTVSSSAGCLVDANSVSPPKSEPAYRIAITRVAYLPLPGDNQAGTRFKISVSWEGLRRIEKETLDYYYEVYK